MIRLRGTSSAAAVVVALAIASFSTQGGTAAASSPSGPTARDVQTRIIGGAPATAGNWPSIAAVYVSGYTPDSTHFCGGTLIASKWVLTAAHCVVDNTFYCSASPCSPNELEVLLGRYSLLGTGGESKVVSRVIPHPSYNASTRTYDLALMELASASTKPVRRLVTSSEAAYWEAGDAAHVAGWGDTDASEEGVSNSPDLREVTVNISSDSACQTAYGASFSSESEVCAGVPEGGKDSCQGDSGGPLEVDTPSGRRLVGLVSFGPLECALPGYPGVYNRTIQSRDWLGSYAATVSTAPLTAFGRVKRARSKVKTLTVSNASSLPAQIASLAVTGAGFTKLSTTCPSTLQSDSTCTVKIRYRPTAKGARTGYLTLTSPTGVVYLSAKLTGIGF